MTCLLQFGKYKGKSFRWLLENDVGYTMYLIKNLKKEEALGICMSERHGKDNLLLLNMPLVLERSSLVSPMRPLEWVLRQPHQKMTSWLALVPGPRALGKRYGMAELMAMRTSSWGRAVSQEHACVSCSSTCGRGSNLPLLRHLLSMPQGPQLNPY